MEHFEQPARHVPRPVNLHYHIPDKSACPGRLPPPARRGFELASSLPSLPLVPLTSRLPSALRLQAGAELAWRPPARTVGFGWVDAGWGRPCPWWPWGGLCGNPTIRKVLGWGGGRLPPTTALLVCQRFVLVLYTGNCAEASSQTNNIAKRICWTTLGIGAEK